MSEQKVKIAYICGPLTQLPQQEQGRVKTLYSQLGDVCEEVMGVRAFVPHEHFDPIKHVHYSPEQVDQSERTQVCHQTNLLVVVGIAPSWGGGIEVEMAYRHSVPVVILKPISTKLSRLLLGNPAVKNMVEFTDFADAKRVLKVTLINNRYTCVRV
jgi:hypothetical protein